MIDIVTPACREVPLAPSPQFLLLNLCQRNRVAFRVIASVLNQKSLVSPVFALE
jgi:hypothetical protein